MNFYNDNDPFAAAWLRELIKAKLIGPGIVDERSICDIRPEELEGFDQCHFFAGIGGWSAALRLAGWPDTGPVWTGSCPCQPLSCSGQRKGHADERHLWPAFYALIEKCRPATVFGEQVAGTHGREWLTGIRADLEGMGYAVGAADLCAAGVGAPIISQRLHWVAAAGHEQARRSSMSSEAQGGRPLGNSSRRGEFGRMVSANGAGPFAGQPAAEAARHWNSAEPASGIGGLGEARRARLEGHAGHGANGDESGRNGAGPNRPIAEAGATDFWDEFDLCYFTGPDAGKVRRIEPGTFPLAHGVSARVGRLRGYGNAIVPQVAAEFIRAFQESTGGNRGNGEEPLSVNSVISCSKIRTVKGKL